MKEKKPNWWASCSLKFVYLVRPQTNIALHDLLECVYNQSYHHFLIMQWLVLGTLFHVVLRLSWGRTHSIRWWTKRKHLPPGSSWGRDVRGGCIDLGFGGKFGTRRGRWLELLCLRMCGSISCAATSCGWSDHSFVWLSAEAGTLLSEQNKSRLMCVV